MKRKVSIILPTFNEKENIEELIKQIYSSCGKELFEVIVVDDNSPDGTWKIVKSLQKHYKSLHLFKRVNEMGLPSAIWAGVKMAKGNIVVWLDCDLSHPPQIIPKLVQYIPRYDVVVASRYVSEGRDNRSFIRVVSSRMINILANIILNLKVKDVTSGFYAVKMNVLNDVKLMQIGYAEYCIRFTYESLKKGFRFKEVGYTFTDRKKGISKTDEDFIKFLHNGYLCGKEIIKLRMEK